MAEGVGLLNLPIRTKTKPKHDDSGAGDGESVPDWGLWEVEERIFRSNESAREALEEMRFELLNEGDARSVLGRRVELSA